MPSGWTTSFYNPPQKYGLALMVYILTFFIVTSIMLRTSHGGFGFVIIQMILINGIVSFMMGMIIAYRYGFDLIHAILLVVSFVASCYIVLNDSALFYTIPYLVLDILGLGLGYFLRNRKL